MLPEHDLQSYCSICQQTKPAGEMLPQLPDVPRVCRACVQKALNENPELARQVANIRMPEHLVQPASMEPDTARRIR